MGITFDHNMHPCSKEMGKPSVAIQYPGNRHNGRSCLSQQQDMAERAWKQIHIPFGHSHYKDNHLRQSCNSHPSICPEPQISGPKESWEEAVPLHWFNSSGCQPARSKSHRYRKPQRLESGLPSVRQPDFAGLFTNPSGLFSLSRENLGYSYVKQIPHP